MFIILGTIVQSVNGPNLVALELISNINIAECASVEYNDVDFQNDTHFQPRKRWMKSDLFVLIVSLICQMIIW
jgi:hypothetical protein